MAVIKMDCLNFYNPPTCLEVVKTDSPYPYKPLTHLAVVKMGTHNIYKLPTCLVVVKTCPPDSYKSPTC